MNLEIRTYPEIRVASLRHVGPYDEIGEAFGRLGAIAVQTGLLKDPCARMIAVYHDNPSGTPISELRSDAGLVVSQSAKIPDSLSEQIVPAGRYACTVYRGEYTGLPGVWSWMMKEAVQSAGANFAEGPSLELYLNNPMTTAQKDLLTQIRIPVTGG